MEDIQTQLSYTEPPESTAPVHQESVTTDIRQGSWSSGMAAGVTQDSWTARRTDSQVPQADLPPTMAPQVPEPAPQPPFFVPGPPVTQPLPGQMEHEQSAVMEEQPVFGQQWTEGARFEESKEVAPPVPRGTHTVI